MRIVLVNWAMVWDGAVKGGGVNGYCQSLALELVARGHEVVYLCGGVTYVPVRVGSVEAVGAVGVVGVVEATGLQVGPCEIRRHPDWLGVRVFEVVNSPVVAPSINQFADPAGEIENPELERKVSTLLEWLAPDVVHFHNVEGFSAGCVRAARVRSASGGRARVFYSLHNYHTVCPQVYLMQGHRRPCHDFKGGRACETCIPAESPEREKQRRMEALVRTMPAPSAPSATEPAPASRTPVLHQIGSELRSLMTGARAGSAVPADSSAREPQAPLMPPVPGVPVLDAAAVGGPLDVAGSDTRGQTAFLLAEQRTAVKPGPGDPEWEPLTNAAEPDPSGVDPQSPFGRRRRAMVEMLNACDGVLAVSDFVRRKYVALGVRPGVIRTNHIGTRLNRVAHLHRDVLFDPPPFDPSNPRPVRLVFMGFNNWFKGLPMFADSLELLSADELRRLHVYVYGLGVGTDEWRFRRMEPRLAGLTVHPNYAYYDVPWIVGGKDIGIVPSVWWDNAPQTVFEFFACGVPVLGANLGGIPDFVHEGVNGLLFAGNDRYDLARRLREIVQEPWKLFDLRANVRPPKDITDHALELEEVYSSGIEVLDRPRGLPAEGPQG